MTEADIQRIRDDLRIERLRRLAANMRRTANNGQRIAAQKRDAARKRAAWDQARQQFTTCGTD